jgi:nucleoporin NUP82
VLWHPLGVQGASLVVLTADGYVRTYDFTIGSEISFEVPDQTLDLYALNGRKRHTGGFAADQDEMMPASCCFGSGKYGWRPFTLYILMRSGDVYALNPVVPSRWVASRDYIQMLSLDITAELEAFSQETTPEYKTIIRHQTKWVNDVLNQEAGITNAQTSFTTLSGNTPPRRSIPTCLKRPEVVGPEPVLQGPFLFEPAPQEFTTNDYPAACDIFHLEAGPVGVIGIVHSDGKLDICIETEALPARWVDKKRSSKLDLTSLPVIASYETISLGIQAGNNSEYTSWPTFTKDPHSSQLWFVNHISGVVAFSMKAWLSKLEAALNLEEDEGILSRTLDTSPRSQVQKIVNTSGKPVDGCCVVYEAYIGYLLIAGHQGGLSSVEFDESLTGTSFSINEDTVTLQPAQRHDPFGTPRPVRFQAPDSTSQPKPSTVALPPTAPKVSILQPPYQPSPEFTKPSTLPQFLKQQKGANKPILFSAETLDAFKTARATLKSEFDALMSGAQEMHDRAAAQRLEYNKQLESLHAMHARLGALANRNIRQRLEEFIERQEQMQQRADSLLRRLIIESDIGLSDAEKKWAKEVNRMSERVVGDGGNTFGKRTLMVGELVKQLLPEAEAGEGEGKDDMVPEELRAGKLKVLKQMLERE